MGALTLHAVIMAGGKGTRLKPYTAFLPKGMMPIADRPNIELLLRQLRHFGFKRVTLSTGHMARILQAYFSAHPIPGLAIDYTEEKTALGTVGALRLLKNVQQPVLVVNCDVVTDLNFREVYEAHSAGSAALTIVLVRHAHVLPLGVVEVDAGGLVRSFDEKPTLEFLVNTGIFVLEPRTIDTIEFGVEYGFDRLAAELMADGQQIASFIHEGSWFDIGSSTEYHLAQDAVESDPHRFLPEEYTL